MADEIRIEMVEGDRLPEPEFTLVGTDITGFTITMHVDFPVAGPTSKPAVIVDAAQGQFKFTWAAAEVEAGVYDAEVQIIDAGGLPLTSKKFLIDAREQIA